MSVPNHSDVPKQLFETGDYDLTTHDGQAAYVDDVVIALHLKDQRWGHLKKSGSQTNIHGHAEDAALYLSDTSGQSQAVDFIAGAGGPNPHPQWNVDIPRYSRSDWYPPSEHPPVDEPDEPDIPPTPIFKARDQFYAEFKAVNEFYAAPDGLKRVGGMVIDSANPVRCDVEAMGKWGYDLLIGKTVDECKAEIRHSDEWKQKHPGEMP